MTSAAFRCEIGRYCIASSRQTEIAPALPLRWITTRQREPWYDFEQLNLIGEGWAFARAEDACIALYASQPFESMRRRPDAHRELRAPGLRNVWLCQMGARDTDASFESFRHRVLASQTEVDDLHVRWETIRGDRLEFDRTGPLLLNGQEQPITGFKHHESIYGIAEFPALTMDIGYGQDVLRLNFS